MANKLTDSSLWWRKREKKNYQSNNPYCTQIHTQTYTHKHTLGTTSGCRNMETMAPNEKEKSKLFQLKI